MAVPVTLSNTAATLLPPTITGPIFAKATESSAVMNMARRIPLAVNAHTAIPVSMDVPAADWVGEGGVKAVGQEASVSRR
jgi:HK97 family phage major capsid protein